MAQENKSGGYLVKRISITGPESTGKSELAKQLATVFNVPMVPEYARIYLDGLDRDYDYNDILEIAKGQYELENTMFRKSKGLLFCDTDFLVTMIWCEYKYGKCHPWIKEMADKHAYDFYLLCDIDLPWEFDPMREHPDNRKELMEFYKLALDNMKRPYYIVKGRGVERTYNAAKNIKYEFLSVPLR